MIIKHFSHIDTDGIGAVVISQRIFPSVSYDLCDYENINRRVSDFVGSLLRGCFSYSMVVITDISVDENTAKLIEKADKELPNTKFILLDHHERAMWLNQYTWAFVSKEKEVKGRMVKTCGTSLWCDHLLEQGFIDKEDEIVAFSELVRQWDTFEWMRLHNEKANELNLLLSIKGKERFIERFTENIETEWTPEEKILLREEKFRIRRYVDGKRREMKTYTSRSGYRIGVVFAEQHISTIASQICKYNSDIDIAMVCSLSTGRASIRTMKDDIKLNEIAATLGGGGREKRAGFPLESIFDIKLDLSKI